MNTRSAIGQSFAVIFALALAVLPACAVAQEAPTIVRIEEDWVAYIRNPDAAVTAPQIVNVISPAATTDAAFGIIELNHASQPDFQSGGFQVQSWVGSTRNEFVFSSFNAPLMHAYDKLTYTVSMEIADGQIAFGLKDGRSRTWGRFAQTAVRARCPAEGVTLADYDPQFSVDNTSINVGAHRVEVLYQTETRYYSASGLESTDTTDRVIHRFRELVQYVSLEEYEQNADNYNIEITE
ncbi:MAG: hypothetical protein R3C19_19300 [Planctomycetaceae bacterium]